MVDCVHGMMEGTCALCSGRERPRSTARRADAGIASLHFTVGSVEVECPYNAEFIADLKAALPSYARAWDGQQRVWSIAGEWWEQAEEIVVRYFTIAE